VDSEDAETYLRLLAETELRRARAGGPDAEAGRAALVRDVATAFAWTRVLDGELALSIADGYSAALDARPTARDDFSLRPLGGHGLPGHRKAMAARSAMAGTPPGDIGPLMVTPAAHVLRSDRHADTYVLAVVRTPTRTWLRLAVHTGRLQPSHLPAPGTPRLPRGAGRPGFPPALTATDSAGTTYRLGMGGGGGADWFHGQAELRPSPPAGTAWVDVSGGGEPARIDLTARPPRAQVAVTSVDMSPGEAYVEAQADALLANRRQAFAADLARLAAVVPALATVGMLPAGSAATGRVRWLCERFGVTGHGLTSLPAEPLERWAGLLAWQDGREERPDAYFSGNGDRALAASRVAMADLAVTLPEADRLVIALAGLISHGDGTAVHAVYYGTGARAPDPDELPSCWLRDDDGQYHGTARRSWTSDPNGLSTFRAEVLPPVRPSVNSVEVLVCGRTTEVRALVPLTWRTL
jgi:hypothetical protein